MLKSITVAAVAVTCVGAFQAPSGFMGTGLRSEMSAADDAAVSRRAALGAILGGALAVPASAFASYGSPKNRDENWQLKDNGVMTGVVSSSMSGTRVSGFRSAVFSNNEAAKTFPRKEISDAEIGQISSLTDKLVKNDGLKKYKTSNKIGINPGFGGSSGIFTGAK